MEYQHRTHTHTIGPVVTTLESGYFAEQYAQRQAENAGVPRGRMPRVYARRLEGDQVELTLTWTWTTIAETDDEVNGRG